jgi:hypothetical protein
MKTAREIITETFEYYNADPSRRGLDSMEGCVYISQDGTKCAVGRCMTPYALEAILRAEGEVGFCNGDPVPTNLDNFLMPEYRGHPVRLWELLQDFHDTHSLWPRSWDSVADTIRRDQVRHEMYQTLLRQYS